MHVHACLFVVNGFARMLKTTFFNFYPQTKTSSYRTTIVSHNYVVCTYV